MATAVNENKVEDFVTCGVCMCEYDEVNRKPKFLQCAHTVCLVCLQKISSEKDVIVCPFCRNTANTFTKKNDVNSLPDNTYALQILKMNKKKEEPATTPINQLILNWCLTCGSAEKLECAPSSHVSVNMTVDTIRNLESSLLNLKEELLKLKEEESNLLSMAVEKRKEVSQHLSLIVESISAAGDQTQKCLDKNNHLLAEMISLKIPKASSPNAQSPEHETKTDLFLSELMALVDNSDADDTAETLKLKMNKSVELCKKKLCEATALASECHLRENEKVSIQLFDEKDQRIPTLTWLEDGFRLNAAKSSTNFTDVRLDLMLIAHSIFSLLKRKKIELKCETRHQNTLASVPSSIPPCPVRNNFVLGQSIFILSLMKSGNQLAGEIHIRPTLTFNSDFLQSLGEFTYKSQKLFSSSIQKAVPVAYVLFKLAHKNFKPINPALLVANGYEHFPPAVNVFCQVGVVLVKSAADKKTITGWSFLFPLDNFLSPNYNIAIKSVSPAKCFGQIINSNVLETLKQVSALKSQERTVYSLYVESR